MTSLPCARESLSAESMVRVFNHIRVTFFDTFQSSVTALETWLLFKLPRNSTGRCPAKSNIEK